jgi:hypothetical protein
MVACGSINLKHFINLYGVYGYMFFKIYMILLKSSEKRLMVACGSKNKIYRSCKIVFMVVW